MPKNIHHIHFRSKKMHCWYQHSLTVYLRNFCSDVLFADLYNLKACSIEFLRIHIHSGPNIKLKDSNMRNEYKLYGLCFLHFTRVKNNLGYIKLA
jgi:hypothetical protein